MNFIIKKTNVIEKMKKSLKPYFAKCYKQWKIANIQFDTIENVIRNNYIGLSSV